MLFWALLASGQISMRKVDGWQSLGQPPAESDIQRFFRVSPPSVHQMLLTLERAGLISRVPSQWL